MLTVTKKAAALLKAAKAADGAKRGAGIRLRRGAIPDESEKPSVGFTITDERDPDDEEFEQQGLQIFVEDALVEPLDGRTLDVRDVNPKRASGWRGRFAFWLSAAIALAILIAPGPARAATDTSGPAISGGPTSLVKSVIDQATAVAREGQLSPADRQKKLRAIAEANFDFTHMARTTLSYHWSQLTPQQRDQFVPPFTSFMENVYLSIVTRGVLRILGAFTSFIGNEYSSELRDYSVESQSTVTFTGEEIGDGYADVHSRMVIPEHPQLVPVDYLLKRENGTWKIYDLEIDAISVMANYSNQFNRVINDDSYPALVLILHRKTHELDASLTTTASR